jgi:hypothetical protein
MTSSKSKGGNKIFIVKEKGLSGSPKYFVAGTSNKTTKTVLVKKI